jgi:hypothetical protein
LSTIDAVYIALAFLVPGFVFSAARNQFITGQVPQGSEQLLRFLTYSAINYAVFSAPIYLFFNAQLSPVARALFWWAVMLMGPAFFGSLSGIAARNGWIQKALRWMKLNPIHAVPTAWDYKFGRMEGEWVLVTLKTGVRFAGFCGNQSFASSDSKERDLYIQKLFDIGENDVWTPTKKSALIASGEISTIEFWPVTQEENSEQPQTADATRKSESALKGLSTATDIDYSDLQAERGASADYRAGCSVEPAQSGLQRQKIGSRVTEG